MLMVSAERSKNTSITHKLEELRQLLRDKTLAMETLNKMLHGSSGGAFNRPARSHNSSYCHFSSGGGNGSAGYRKAVEFLRGTGRYSGSC